MTIKQWMAKQTKNITDKDEAKSILDNLYQECIHDTGSTMILDTYKRKVREFFSSAPNLSENPNETDPLFEINSSDKNQTTISYKGPRIRTVDQLLQMAEVNLDDWIIDKVVINKWEQGRGNKKVKLTWIDGKKSGEESDDGTISIEPLIKIEVQLRRRVLEPSSLPPLNKIDVKVSKINLKPTTKVKSLKTAIIISDAQMGFMRDSRTGTLVPLHDRKALSIFLQMVKFYKPDEIILNGDWFDFTDASDKFVESPDYYNNLQPIFLEFAWVMAQVKKASPNTKIMFLEGNHEDRLRKSVIKYQAFAHGLKNIDDLEGYEILSIPNLTGFKDLDIEYIGSYRNSRVWIGDNVEVSHGKMIRAGSGATVKALVSSVMNTTLIGHIHRCEMASRTVSDRDGRRTIEVWSFGAMCRTDGIVPSQNGKENWQGGFGIVQWTDDSYNILPVKIENGYTLFDGKAWQGMDYSADIAHDCNWPTLDITNFEENTDNLYY